MYRNPRIIVPLPETPNDYSYRQYRESEILGGSFVLAIYSLGGLLANRWEDIEFDDIGESPFADDPILEQSSELRIRPFLWFHLVVGVSVMLTFIANFLILGRSDDFHLGIGDQLNMIITIIVSVFAIAYGHGLLAFLTFVTVCDVLRRARTHFVEAVKSQRVQALKVTTYATTVENNFQN